MVCKISQPKRGPAKSLLGCEIISQPQEAYCEIRPPLRNRLSQPHAPPLQNAPLAHECHFAAASIISQPLASFRSCEMLCEIPNA